MKKIKSLISAILACLLCIILCSCVSKDTAAGTWRDNYIYNGSEFSVTLVLEENGHYTYVSYKNGSLSKAMEGEWETIGNEVCIYTETGSTSYDYIDGKLANGSQNLTKD